MTDSNLPQWLYENNNYTAPGSSDRFISKNIISFLSVLKKLNRGCRYDYANAAFKLIFVLCTVLMIALSGNISFLLVLGSALLVAIAFFDAQREKRIISTVLIASAVSGAVLLPCIFTGNPQSLITLTLKTAVTVGIIGVFRESTSASSLTSSMAALHIPGIIIYIFQWTFKYIFILSLICTDMLLCLKTRLIGKRIKGSKAYSGILSVCFIKSRAMADECSHAMVCRGFSGVYPKQRIRLTSADAVISAVFSAVAAAFVYLEILL